MRIPYTYLLKCPDGRAYYGVKYGKDANPDTFWSKYFTSSAVIQEMRKEYGDDAFTYEIRRTFDTVEQAQDWEEKVLTRLNVSSNPKWVNKHSMKSNMSAERSKNGTHHFFGGEIQRKANLKRIAEGKNPLSAELSRKTAQRQLADGTHPWKQGKQSEWAKKKVEEGVHHFLGGKIQSESNKRRIAEGTHPFGSELSSKTAKRQALENRHPFQLKQTCPDCGLTSTASGIKRHKCQGRHIG